MGRAATLIRDLTRVARDVGPRVALATAIDISARWIVKRSALGPSTLESRTTDRIADTEQRLRQELERVESQCRLLDARQADLDRREHELEETQRRVADHAAGVADRLDGLRLVVDEHRRASDESQQRLFDGVWRVTDSLRVLTRVQEAEVARVAEADIDGLRPVGGLRISVVVPVHNRADRLPTCLDSILAQRYSDLEVVVVDDGSTDGIAPAMVPYLDDRRVQFLQLDHLGDVSARNAGLSRSTGEVIVNFDSDNRMHAGYLERLAQAYARHPEAVCAVAAMVWEYDGAHVHIRHDSFEWGRLLRQEVSLDTNCFSYRRSLRDALGDWDPTLTRHSDWELALRYTRDHPPMPVDAVAAFYDARRAADRISFRRASVPNVTRIAARYREPVGRPLRVLVHCYDYPQLSESYVDTEVAWMLRQGVSLEVVSMAEPGACGEATVPARCGDLEQHLDRFQPNLVQCHWLSMVAPVADAVRERGLPLTVRSHGFEFSHAAVSACLADGVTRSIYLFPNLVGDLKSNAVNLLPVPACFNSERFYPRLDRDRRLVLRTAACLDTKDLDSFLHVAAASTGYRFVLALAKVASLPDLPAQFEALNASLGNPVEIQWNVTHGDMSELTAQAGVYLHTFGFQLPFGMPVSIAEAMACGAVPIVRDSPGARAYIEDCGLYYDSVADAVRLLDKLSSWSDDDFREHSIRCADFAYSRYADEVVLPAILDDWRLLVSASDPR